MNRRRGSLEKNRRGWTYRLLEARVLLPAEYIGIIPVDLTRFLHNGQRFSRPSAESTASHFGEGQSSSSNILETPDPPHEYNSNNTDAHTTSPQDPSPRRNRCSNSTDPPAPAALRLPSSPSECSHHLLPPSSAPLPSHPPSRCLRWPNASRSCRRRAEASR